MNRKKLKPQIKRLFKITWKEQKDTTAVLLSSISNNIQGFFFNSIITLDDRLLQPVLLIPQNSNCENNVELNFSSLYSL